MKTIEELLKNLARPEVLEFGLVTNRLPSVNIGGKFEPVDDEAPSTERLVEMLVTMGGSRFVEALSDKPVQWTTRVDGVGVIAIAAVLQKDVVQARFTVAKRDTAARAPSDKAVPVTKPVSGPTPSVPRLPSDKAAPVTSPISGSTPAAARQSGSTPAARSSAPHLASARDARGPASAPTVSAEPANNAPAQAVTHSVMPRAPSAPAPELTLDELDNEITLQTQSPPLKKSGVEDPRPKPARRPEEVVETQRVKPASAPAAATRRIATPTSVDAVDGDLTQPIEDTAKMRLAEKDRPRVDPAATVDSFLAMALAARATELFVVAGRAIQLRVATDLVPRTQAIAPEHVERMARDVIPARLRELLEREGACDFAVEHPVHGRFRVNASKQQTGFKLSFRVIAKELPSLESLGLSPALVAALSRRTGLVLVSGPACQGKSTTLAALVDHLNRETAQHIMTIEDPIEHVHPRKRSLVSQRDVSLHGRTRARMIQTVVREDVDTLVLGEIRDVESMRQALVACESGRLVLASMNAPTAAKAIDRALDLFPPAEEPWARGRLASSLQLVIGQRLLPSVDRGRLHPALELLPWSAELYTLIHEARTFQIAELQKRGHAAGQRRLDESLADLVQAQRVTIDTAKQVAESPSELETLVARSGTAPVAVQGRKV